MVESRVQMQAKVSQRMRLIGTRKYLLIKLGVYSLLSLALGSAQVRIEDTQES